MKKNPDNSFSLKVTKSLVTASGIHKLKIAVEDGKGGREESSIDLVITIANQIAAKTSGITILPSTGTSEKTVAIKGIGSDLIYLPKNDEDVKAINELTAKITKAKTEEDMRDSKAGGNSAEQQI